MNDIERLIDRLRAQAVRPVPFPAYALNDAADALEALNRENEELIVRLSEVRFDDE